MIAHSTGFGIDTSITHEGIKLVLLVKSPLKEMMQSCTYLPHVSKMTILARTRAMSVIIKDTIILNIMHNIFKHRDMYYIAFMKES